MTFYIAFFFQKVIAIFCIFIQNLYCTNRGIKFFVIVSVMVLYSGLILRSENFEIFTNFALSSKF